MGMDKSAAGERSCETGLGKGFEREEDGEPALGCEDQGKL